MGVATCHTVTRLPDGSLAGNKVECELLASFKNIDMQQEETLAAGGNESPNERSIAYYDSSSSSSSRKPLFRTVRQFEFDQKIQLQSVIVEIGSSSEAAWIRESLHVFAKGSPEKIAARCRPESLPASFAEETQNISREGYYLIAVACKRLRNGKSDVELSRDSHEKDLDFLGLIYFKNHLKPCTAAAIKDLNDAGVETRMITGDNVWNGLHIAKSCGMISKREWVIVGNFEKQTGQLTWQWEWKSLASEKYLTSETASCYVTAAGADAAGGDDEAAPLLSRAQMEEWMKLPIEEQILDSKQILGISQSAFSHLQENEPKLLARIFPRIIVFGGMNPAGKVDVVKIWGEKCVVGMCGDGGNDCGALRTAHVGLALAAEHGSSEVSLVAPFSSSGSDPNYPGDDHVASVRAVVEIIKEGRCALENSMGCFKFFILYGLFNMFSKGMLAPKETYYSEMAFLIQDAILTVSLTYAMASCLPCEKLMKSIPSANSLGFGPAFAVLSMLAIEMALLFYVIQDVESTSWYWPVDLRIMRIQPTEWWNKNGMMLSGITLMIAAGLALQAAVVFSLGGKFRQPVYKNKRLMGNCLVFIALFVYAGVSANTPVNCLIRLNCTNDKSWRSHVPFFQNFLGSGKEVRSNGWFFVEEKPVQYLVLDKEVLDPAKREKNALTDTPEELFRENAAAMIRPDSTYFGNVAAKIRRDHREALLPAVTNASSWRLRRTVKNDSSAQQLVLEASVGDVEKDEANFVCQTLCSATWEIGEAADSYRFYCWHPVTTVEEGKAKCYLLPRLDGKGEVSLGPGLPNFIDEQLVPERMKKLKYIDAAQMFLHGAHTRKALSALSNEEIRTQVRELALRAEKPTHAEAGSEVTPVGSAFFLNRHNVLGWSPSKASPLLKYTQPTLENGEADFSQRDLWAWKLIGNIALVWFITYLLNRFLINGSFGQTVYDRFNKRKF